MWRRENCQISNDDIECTGVTGCRYNSLQNQSISRVSTPFAADILHDICQSIIHQTINVCQSTAPSVRHPTTKFCIYVNLCAQQVIRFVSQNISTQRPNGYCHRCLHRCHGNGWHPAPGEVSMVRNVRVYVEYGKSCDKSSVVTCIVLTVLR